MPFKISLKDTSIHISLNSFGLYLSPKCLLNFLLLVYSTMWRKSFQIDGVRITSKCIESRHFYSCPRCPPKTPGRIFCEYVFPSAEWDGEIYDLHYENMKITWSIRLFMFCMICILFWILALQFCKQCLAYSVILSSLPLLLCNHDNLTLKLHQIKSYLNGDFL